MIVPPKEKGLDEDAVGSCDSYLVSAPRRAMNGRRPGDRVESYKRKLYSKRLGKNKNVQSGSSLDEQW